MSKGEEEGPASRACEPSNVIRLPVQHPKHPLCPFCTKELPTFDGAQVLTLPERAFENVRVEAIAFHVRCLGCSRLLILQKERVPADQAEQQAEREGRDA